MKELIIEAKTTEEAIVQGCEQMGVDRDDVSVEILEMPKKGFLGIGATPARVKVSLFELDTQKPETPKVKPQAAKGPRPQPVQPNPPRAKAEPPVSKKDVAPAPKKDIA